MVSNIIYAGSNNTSSAVELFCSLMSRLTHTEEVMLLIKAGGSNIDATGHYNSSIIMVIKDFEEEGSSLVIPNAFHGDLGTTGNHGLRLCGSVCSDEGINISAAEIHNATFRSFKNKRITTFDLFKLQTNRIILDKIHYYNSSTMSLFDNENDNKEYTSWGQMYRMPGFIYNPTVRKWNLRKSMHDLLPLVKTDPGSAIRKACVILEEQLRMVYKQTHPEAIGTEKIEPCIDYLIKHKVINKNDKQLFLWFFFSVRNKYCHQNADARQDDAVFVIELANRLLVTLV